MADGFEWVLFELALSASEKWSIYYPDWIS